jgi:protocatechuate 3,4-dioxygenase beta subunit
MLFAGTAMAQQPSASIQGTVTQVGATDTKIPGATVELRREGGVASMASAPLLTTITDAEGRYYFPNLAPGPYRVVAKAGGYVRTEFGQKRTNGAGLAISLTANQRIVDATIALTPTGSISGRVTDASGQPVVLADVFALKTAYQEGQRTFVQSLSAKTDDRGEYRIFWMTPGLYYVNVIVPDGTQVSNLLMNADGLDTQLSMSANRLSVRDVFSRPIGTGAGPNEAHVPVYFPTTTDPRQAQPVDVKPGSDIRGVDIAAIRVNTRSVRGTIFNTVSGKVPGKEFQAQVRLLPTDPAVQQFPGTVNLETGKFEIVRVVPGTYMLYGQMRPTGATGPAETFWASTPVEIRERDLEDIALATAPGVPLPGRIVVDDNSGAPPPSLQGMFIGMRPEPLVGQNAPSPGTQAAADGTFDLPPIIPGRFRVYVFPWLLPNNPGLLSGMPPTPPGIRDLNLYVKSIRAGNADVINTGLALLPGVEGQTLEIVLGKNAGAIEGRVLSSQKQPVDGAVVGLIPAAATARGFRMDMYKSTSTDATGKFQVQGLPPGEYKAFAWEDFDRNALIDLDFMRGFENLGTSITVGEGEKPSVELLVIPAN